MRSIKALSILLLLPLMAMSRPRMHYITFGPMFHFNFGNGPWTFSGGFEMAYWNYPLGSPLSDGGKPVPDDGEPGYSIDAGIDLERTKTRIYCEPQIGEVIAGLSLGPVLEWKDGSLKP